MSYYELVKLVEGVEDTLDSVTIFSHKYILVNSNGETLYVTFDENGKCTIFNEVFLLLNISYIKKVLSRFK